MFRKKPHFILLLFSLLFIFRCGVYGPPLPPIPDTPEKSDPVVRVSPSPSSLPSIGIKKTKSHKKKTK